MSQLPLFASARETLLVDDERGRIVHTPAFVTSAVAAAWFTELRESVAWTTQRRRMYDRDVDVPRLMANFELPPKDDGHPAALSTAATQVIAATGVSFNSAGLNLYRDGRDSVAPHGDLDDIVHGSPVALLSLGSTRRMTIRTRALPSRAFHLDLAAGSLLVMSYETQVHYTHAIPKTNEPVGPRISLAFRVRPTPRHPEAEASTTDR
jgi:alkylated DNA repair dioxygenase AlkB